MRLIDTHCHLADARLWRQADDVLARARDAGLIACVCAAGDLRESNSAAALAAEHAGVYCTAGVHPHEARHAGEGYLKAIELLAADAGNVAIGEIGLDYHYDFSPRDVQRRVFAEQLALARRLEKRVVVHVREALEDTLAIVRESLIDPANLVFHSFTEGPSQARGVLDIGAMVSFSGIATFNSAARLRQSVALVPDERILIETDSPYLSPEPVRKVKTNEPANVRHVATCLAVVRRMTLEAFAELTTANATVFFGLVQKRL